MSERRRCVVDASILFDFFAGDIFDSLFSPPFDHRTSDFVADEIADTYSPDQLRTLGLTILDLDEIEVAEIQTIQSENPHLSIEDISLFILVRRDGGVLLTGDKLLNQYACSHTIECHGTLWILGELIRFGPFRQVQARAALLKMLSADRRLPRPECETLLRRWREDEE